MAKEVGYLVCRQGRVYLKQNETLGEAHSVDVSTRCSRGEPVALVHTHNVNPHPSQLDLQTAKERKLVVCVDWKGRITCWKVK
ncbi:MAG: hypothetical protein Q8O55_06600 [Dehalococcoidales bacterium]|nr:hypothetical protein [Dehalococcoidales bacterium]